MILDATQQAKLKDYLLVTLESISEADNDALAEYILALLKNDKPHSQLQRECSEQLEEFLESHTKNFVLGLFIWLKKNGVFAGSNGHVSNDSPQEQEENSTLTLPKQDSQTFNREPKVKNSKTQSYYPSETHDTRHSNKASAYGGKQNLDHLKPGRCPDFETKGFCVEGKNCRFTHEDAIPMDQQEVLGSQGRNNPGLIDALNRPLQDDYDPSDPYFGNPGSRSNMAFSSRRPRGGYSLRGRSADREHFSKFNNTRPTRFNYREHKSSTGTTLSLVSIPKDKLSENTIKEYFVKFDEIVNIVLDRNNAKADIEFKSSEGANKAYTSPDPIFDNRFVKLYWKHAEHNNRGPFYTPTFINNSLPAKTVDPAEKSKKEALLRKRKADLLAKQLEEQKKMLDLIQSKSISEEDKKFLLKSMNQLTDSIKESLDTIAQTQPSSAKKIKVSNQSPFTSETVNPVSFSSSTNSNPLLRSQPRPGFNKWFPPRPEVTQSFRLDNRPTSFKIFGFNIELQPTVEAHLKNVRGVENVVFKAEDPSFVVECRNHYLAKRAQIDSSKLGENTFQSSWVDKTETTNLDQTSLPVTNH